MSRPIKEVFCGRKALPRAFVVISFFLSALLLSAGTFLLTIDNAAAQSPEGGISTAAETAQTAGSDQANVQVDVNILPVLSLAVYPVGNHTTETDQVVLEPVSGGDLATNMLDLVVRTNVRTGYQLSIKDEDATTALVHTTDSTRTIPALDTSTNTASFPDNRWGYSVGAYNADNSEFHAVPATTPNLIAQSEELLPGDGETTTVTFGVKIDNTVVGGIYEDKVVFTASPNLIPSIFKVTIHYRFADGTEAAPDYSENYVTGATYSVASPEVAGYTPSQAVVSGTVEDEDVEVTVTYGRNNIHDIDDLLTMQEMTSEVCNNTPTPTVGAVVVPENTLKDVRDNKTYKISKLADGKCWMTQDLNFILSTSKALTPADSDVPSNWIPSNDTQTTDGVKWTNTTSARSYTNEARTLYNFFAATAGSALAKGEAPNSICPKGWTLPTITNIVNLVSNTYKVSSDATGIGQILGFPLDFNYTGGYSSISGLFDGGDGTGAYWSNYAINSDAAYFLLFDVNLGVRPQYSNRRADGYAVRCVAK